MQARRAWSPHVVNGRRGRGWRALLVVWLALGSSAQALDTVTGLEFVAAVPLLPPHFGRPTAIAAGALGQLFVADPGRGTVLRIQSNGAVLFEFDAPSGSPGLQPFDLEVAGFKVYVLDAQSSSLLRYSDRGSFLDVLRSFQNARGEMPQALSVDTSGRVLLCQTPLHVVRVLDEASKTEIVLGGFGTRPGELARPAGVAFAPGGGFYVSDTGNARLARFSAVGNFEAVSGDSLGEPRGLAVGSSGEVYVADAKHRSVQLFGPSGLSRAILSLPEWRPIDVTVVADTLFVLSAAPPALLRARVLREP